MAEIKTTPDYLSHEEEQPPKLSSGLNVLTILTFIGCALGLIGGVWGYIKADENYKTMIENREKFASSDAPGWAKGMMSPEMVEMSRLSAENKLPIMLLTLVGVGLCLWGALEMRKLKKQGFILWVAGEFLPIIGGAVFLGFGMFKGFGLLALVVPVIFLILYGVNRKHLVY